MPKFGTALPRTALFLCGVVFTRAALPPNSEMHLPQATENSIWKPGDSQRQLQSPVGAPFSPAASPVAVVAPLPTVPAPSLSSLAPVVITLTPSLFPTTSAPSIATNAPSAGPTSTPQPSLSLQPSVSQLPTVSPTDVPSVSPTVVPSMTPSVSPTQSLAPSDIPSAVPSESLVPSSSPSLDLDMNKDVRLLSKVLLSVIVPRQQPSDNAVRLRQRRTQSALELNQTEWEDITHRHIASKLEEALANTTTPYVFLDFAFEGAYTSVFDDLSANFTQVITNVVYFDESPVTPSTEQLDSYVRASFVDTAMFEYVLLLQESQDPLLASTQKVIVQTVSTALEDSGDDDAIDIGQILLYAGIGAGSVGCFAIAYFVYASHRGKCNSTNHAVDLKEKPTDDETSLPVDDDQGVIIMSPSKAKRNQGFIESDQELPPPPSDDDASSTYSYLEKGSLASMTDLYAITEQRNQELYDEDDMTDYDSESNASVLVSLQGDGDSVRNTSFTDIWTDEGSVASSNKKQPPHASIAQDTRGWEAKYGIPPSAVDEEWDGAEENIFHEGVPSNIFAVSPQQGKKGSMPVSIQDDTEGQLVDVSQDTLDDSRTEDGSAVAQEDLKSSDVTPVLLKEEEESPKQSSNGSMLASIQDDTEGQLVDVSQDTLDDSRTEDGSAVAQEVLESSDVTPVLLKEEDKSSDVTTSAPKEDEESTTVVPINKGDKS